MARINNFMTRDLIIKRPRGGDLPRIITPDKTPYGDIVIKPGHSAEVEFWDKVKNHPVYLSLLDRHKISVGNEKAEAVEHFTSAGDTLKAPERLDPESMKEEATAEGVKNLAYEQEPAIATKRRGRKPKAESEPESEGEDA